MNHFKSSIARIMKRTMMGKVLLFFCSLCLLVGSSAQADEVYLLEDPNEALQARIDLIEQAQESIEMEYYKIHGGEVAETIVGVLYEAAQRGVKVRILIGGLTHLFVDQPAVTMLVAHPNIDVRFHNSMEEFYKPSHWLMQLHDKVLLADGTSLISGGRNIGDKYYERLDEGEGSLTIDRDILIDGGTEGQNIPRQVQEYFNEFWDDDSVSLTHTENRLNESCTGHKLLLYLDGVGCSFLKERLISKARERAIELQEIMAQKRIEAPEEFATGNDWSTKTQPVAHIRFVHDPVGNKKRDNGTAKALADELRKAEKSALYFSPYLIKTAQELETAEILQDKNVKQTVLTNSPYSGANLFGLAGTLKYFDDFAHRGMTYWMSQGEDNLHHKTYMIDDDTAIISTYNYDQRSEWLNTEMLYIIEDRDFAQIVRDANDVFFAESLQIDADGAPIAREGVEQKEVGFGKKASLTLVKFIMPLIAWAI